jgi:transcriptional regulator with XRE-family HTH domain
VDVSVMKDTKVATPAQCRAARALLNWTQAVLAERAGVARKTIADFELASRTLHIRTRRDITATLEAAGIEFMWGEEGSRANGSIPGDGVRFGRKFSPKLI